MRVRDAMTRDVERVAPGTTLCYAARRIEALDVGSLPVCQGQHVIGMLTDRDITIRATVEGMDPRTTPVSTVMSHGAISCSADQDIAEAAEVVQVTRSDV